MGEAHLVIEVGLNEEVGAEFGHARARLAIGFLLGEHAATEALLPFWSRTVCDRGDFCGHMLSVVLFKSMVLIATHALRASSHCAEAHHHSRTPYSNSGPP